MPVWQPAPHRYLHGGAMSDLVLDSQIARHHDHDPVERDQHRDQKLIAIRRRIRRISASLDPSPMHRPRVFDFPNDNHRFFPSIHNVLKRGAVFAEKALVRRVVLLAPRRPPMKQLPYTSHALQRCRNRSIRKEAVEAVLEFGRPRFDRGAEIFTLRWRDVRRWAAYGYELSRFEGIEVISGSGGRLRYTVTIRPSLPDITSIPSNRESS